MQAAAAEGTAEEDVEDSSSNVAAEPGQQIPGALAQLTACYREISDGDDDADAERYQLNIGTHIHYRSHFLTNN